MSESPRASTTCSRAKAPFSASATTYARFGRLEKSATPAPAPRRYSRSFLLPPSPDDWLPEGHLAYFILDIVGELDLSAIIRAVDAKDARGERPYSPVMMVALLLLRLDGRR